MLLQVDEALAQWRAAQLPSRPKYGWIRAIRGALRMSGTALARRLGVTESTVRKFEASEADDAITLATLRRVADAMGCELQYALVPKKPLEQALFHQARAIVAAELEPVRQTMALEGQCVEENSTERILDSLARALLARGHGRNLW